MTSDAEKILLISSEQILLDLQNRPEASAYTIRQASNPEEALKTAGDFGPDLVLISEKLPKGAGLALAGKLLGDNPLLEVILISPEDSELTARQLIRAGVSDWLHEPLKQDILWLSVELSLRNKHQRTAWLEAETKKTTGSLQQRVEDLDTILTQIQDGVIVIDEDDTLLMVNPIARSAFNLGDEDLSNKTYDQVFSQRDILMAIRGEAPDPARIEVQTDDHTYYRIYRKEIPEIGLVISLHDISYLKELNRMKTEFVTTVSHDLRSPLTSILGYVELIRRAGEINTQQDEYITQVQESVHQITKLINEVLDLGRIEGSYEKDFSKTSLAEITGKVLTQFKPRIDQCGHSLVTDIDPKLPPILGDSVQLRQMIENLVGNAIKYTPEGGRIEITAGQEDKLVIFRIKDTGRGIPLEDQSKIFEPFYRAKNVSEDTQGTGLGLAITRSVVENHRGRIWLDSSTEKGSTFTVMLPIMEE
jgi:signal transduction histidine kinase